MGVCMFGLGKVWVCVCVAVYIRGLCNVCVCVCVRIL